LAACEGADQAKKRQSNNEPTHGQFLLLAGSRPDGEVQPGRRLVPERRRVARCSHSQNCRAGGKSVMRRRAESVSLSLVSSAAQPGKLRNSARPENQG
jgi:hypothetical protein